VGFIFSFAAGLLTLPVTGAALLPLVSRLVGLTLNGNFETAELMQIFQGGAWGLAIGVGGSTFIQAALGAFFLPAFFGLFYIDLKVRGGELPERRPRRAPARRKPG